MSFSGNLQDVSLADVLQFVHLGARSGTITFHRSGESAVVSLHEGKIVYAHHRGSRRLGDILIAQAIVDQDQIDLVLWERSDPSLSLGQALLGAGLIQPGELRVAVELQIEESVRELLTWTRGTFEFRTTEEEPIDDLGVFPEEVLPDVGLDVQRLLLEAARLFDERRRTDAGRKGAQPARGEPSKDAAAPVSLESARPAAGELRIVSFDSRFIAEVMKACPAGTHWRRSLIREAATAEGAVYLVDLSSAGVDDIRHLRQLDPGSSILAIGGNVDAGAAYRAGALAVVPRDAECVAACIQTATSREPVPQGRTSDLAVLKRALGGPDAERVPATMSLQLMQIISELADRAVLFVCRGEALIARGAFGVSPEGEPLASRMQGFVMPLSGGSALVEAARDGHARSVSMDDAGLPVAFRRRVGDPASGSCSVFPVNGAEGARLVVYADNGAREEPIEEAEVIELAARQLGLAFENEALRQRIGARRPTRSELGGG